ncbi:MAG: LPXTG cell wall anchor domain-containing protein [Bacteroidales bacterium]|nr:LPXTG cell wall anchor domain-containing protein [Bacteroidales bacterium]
MKKIILAIALFAAVSANAQSYSDGFFKYNNVEEQRTSNSEWATLPISHGLTGDQDGDSAPLGSGLLLLGGMAVLYASRKRK